MVLADAIGVFEKPAVPFGIAIAVLVILLVPPLRRGIIQS